MEMSAVREVPGQSDKDAMSLAPSVLAVDSMNSYIYAADAKNAIIVQWSFSIGDKDILSAFSPIKVWTGGLRKPPSANSAKYADDGQDDGYGSGTGLVLMDLAFLGTGLYFLTRDGHILAVPQEVLLTRKKSALAKILYSGVGNHLGQVRRLAAAGTYVAWASEVHIMLGSTDDDQHIGELQELITPTYLRSLSGSSTVEITDMKFSWDGKDMFILIWDNSAQALGLYVCAVTSTDEKHSRQLRFTWPHHDYRIFMSPNLAYIYEPTRIWAVPLDVSSDSAEPAEIWRSKSTSRLSALAYVFVKGKDCVVSAWKDTGPCSRTCGGGVLPEARTIQEEANSGGKACPTDLLRKSVCNTDPCPLDCKITDWKPIQKCSNACGGGIRKERRQVIYPSAHGGKPCPPILQRFVSCNEQPCTGIDCILSEWMDDGKCSNTCGSGWQSQFRRVLQSGRFGGISCKGKTLHRKMRCNLTPCQLQGFDPVAAGKLAGFDFDVAQYCEDPELCSLLEAFELTTPPASSTKRMCLVSFAGWLLLAAAAAMHPAQNHR